MYKDSEVLQPGNYRLEVDFPLEEETHLDWIKHIILRELSRIEDMYRGPHFDYGIRIVKVGEQIEGKPL